MNYDILLLATLSQDAFYLVNKKLVKKIGVFPALTLSFLIDKYKFYQKENQLDKQRGFYLKSKKEKSNYIELELGIGRVARRSSIKSLEKKNLLRVKKQGHPARYYYYLNHENILKIISEAETNLSSEVGINPTSDTHIDLSSEVGINPTYSKNIVQKPKSKTDKEKESLPSQDKVEIFQTHHKARLKESRLHGDPDLFLLDKLGQLVDWNVETYDKILDAKKNSKWDVRRNQPNTARWLLATLENENLELNKPVEYKSKWDDPGLAEKMAAEGFV